MFFPHYVGCNNCGETTYYVCVCKLWVRTEGLLRFNRMTFLGKKWFLRAALASRRFQEQLWITQPVVELSTFVEYRSFSGVFICTTAAQTLYLDLHHHVSINLSTSVVTFDIGFISSKVLSSFRSSCPFVLPVDILMNLIWPRCLLRVQDFCQAWLLYPWSDLPLMSE